MRKENAKFDTKFISEPGSYIVNSDYFAFVELRDYACYVIADGIDTDEKKESAKLAVTTVITEFSNSPGMSSGRMKRYLKAAHEALLREADEIRLEASILIMVTDYKKAMWAHVGNCRLLWIKDGNIKLTTHDTSLTQRMVDQEEVPLDQLSSHEERNNLYAYLGQPGRFTPVISAKKKLEDGDIFLLESHGVWEHIGEAEIVDAVDGLSKAEDLCTGLEDVILSQRLDLIENYTIACVFVNKIYQNPKAGMYKRIFKIVFSIVLALSILGATLALTTYNKNKKLFNSLEEYKESGISYMGEKVPRFVEADGSFDKAYNLIQGKKYRKGSKNAQKKLAIEKYQSLVDNMLLGLEYMDKGEHKAAIEKMEKAQDAATELKDTYGEDTSVYEENIEAYLTCAEKLYAAKDDFDKDKQQDAVEKYGDAKRIMNGINDIERRDAVQEELNRVGAAKANRAAAEAEANGDAYVTKEQYEQAIPAFETAIAEYEHAANDYGDASAQKSAELVKSKLEGAQKSAGAKPDEDKVNEAREMEKAAAAAASGGNEDEAKDSLSKAIELLNDLSKPTAETDAIKERLKAQLTELVSDPEPELLDAIRYLTKTPQPDYEKAKAALERAQKCYDDLADKTQSKAMKDYMDDIDDLIKAQAQAQAQAQAAQ